MPKSDKDKSSVLDVIDPAEKKGKKPEPEVEDLEALYETDPKKVAPDVCVNVLVSSLTLTMEEGRGTKTLQQGDRIQGKYYRNMIIEEKRKGRAVEGFQLCNQLPESQLKNLESIRKRRTGEELEDWQEVAKSHLPKGE